MLLQLLAWVAVPMAVVGGLSVRTQASGSLPPVSYFHRVVLDQKGDYVMLWTPEDDRIDFEVQVGTTGYVGLGFSPNGGMKGADIVLGWVDDATGQVFLHDRHADGNFAPIVDESQDVELLGGYQNGTHTVLRFSRPWDTCDSPYDLKLSDDTVRIIWAYSSQDPEDETGLRHHDARGTKSMYLRGAQFTLPTFTPDVKSMDFLISNVSLPGDLDTFYWCKLFKMPVLAKKSHMIGYIPVIEEKNLEYVHHFIFYECNLPKNEEEFENWMDFEGTECYTEDMPASWKYCKTVMVSWAVGGEGEMLPEHVGYPLGVEQGEPGYYLIEVHYDNPNFRQGVTDASGLRMFFTEKLREHDAGTLLIGHNSNQQQIIPPGQEHWVSGSFCDSSCTQQGLPSKGVKIFQGGLHSHLLASAITLKHVRGGRELPVLMEDLTYDFNYQQIRVLKNEVTVLPGDTLILECTYDSRSRSVTTLGGLATDEEMCLAYMGYYPRLKYSSCVSWPEMRVIANSLGVKGIKDVSNQMVRTKEDQEASDKPKSARVSGILGNYVITAPEKYVNRSLLDLVHDEATWRDGVAVAALQEAVVTDDHITDCFAESYRQREGSMRKIPYPTFVPAEEKPDQCSIKSGVSRPSVTPAPSGVSHPSSTPAPSGVSRPSFIPAPSGVRPTSFAPTPSGVRRPSFNFAPSEGSHNTYNTPWVTLIKKINESVEQELTVWA